MNLKAEPLLAKLNELRHEAEGDESDPDWLALHHAFCFLSYKMAEFQKYLDEISNEKKDH
jgi:DNA-binding GntR family transcriptional regulator